MNHVIFTVSLAACAASLFADVARPIPAGGDVFFTVTTIDDHNDGACTVADCTLREAITAANAASPAIISFAHGVAGTIQLSTALPTLTTDIELHGPGPDLLHVRRSSATAFRIFDISNGGGTGPTVTIAGLTISNGDSPGGGGGIQNDHGTVTVRECVLFGNRSSLEHYTYGGGIYNWGGRMTIEQSTIAGNVSKFGGGVASTRTGFGTAVLVIRNSTISGNTAEGGSGGGVYNAAAGSDSIAQMFLFNCTLSGNSATATGFFGGAGGALYNEASNLARAEVELGDCTIAHNNAPSTGGIYNQNLNATARVTLQNTLLQTSPTGSNFTNSNGSIESLGNNLSSDGAGDASNTGTVPGGFLNKPSDRRNTDAMLGPLKDNGGPTFTHALLTGSPAINTGNNDGAADDQRGYLRVGLNDIGAFEFGGVQLRIINIARADSDIVVTFQAAGGLGYSLQRKLNLRGAAWETVNDGTAPSDGPAQITHVGGASTGKAFYRVVRPEA